MKPKSKTEKVCLCGRIITDPNNKTGLCPKCQKMAGDGIAVGGVIGVGMAIKKFGPKLLKDAVKIAKNLKR